MKLLCKNRIKGFSSLLVCFAFYLLFMFGLLDCVRYNDDFVISRFCSIKFTVTSAGLKNMVRYNEDFVI